MRLYSLRIWIYEIDWLSKINNKLNTLQPLACFTELCDNFENEANSLGKTEQNAETKMFREA